MTKRKSVIKQTRMNSEKCSRILKDEKFWKRCTSTWPLNAAWCKLVLPARSVTLTFARWGMSTSTRKTFQVNVLTGTTHTVY